MKLLHIIGALPPAVIGGTEIHALNITNALGQLGFKITILTRRFADQPLCESHSNVSIERIAITKIPKLKRIHAVISFGMRILQQGKSFDMFQVYMAGYLAFVAVWAGRILKKPVCVKVESCGPWFDLKYLSESFPLGLGKIMTRYIVKHATHFIAINSHIKEDLEAWGVNAERISLVPNGVIVPNQSWDRRQVRTESLWGIPIDRPWIMSVGRLDVCKNHHMLLKGLMGLIKEGHIIDVIIAGQGDQRGTLTQYAQSMDIDKHVHFLGEVSTDNIQKLLKASDMFVLPSFVEGCSIALLEAMALGMPIIVSDVPGNCELISHQSTGIVFDPNQAGDLAGAIQTILNGKGRVVRWGEQARRIIKEKFSIESNAYAYCLIYQKLLKWES